MSTASPGRLQRGARWLWRALNKERSLPTRRRGVRGRAHRRSRAGIALLLTVSIVALMTVLVTEVVQAATVRIQLAANQRDEAKAEALALGGVQFYRLVLIASKQLEGSPMITMVNDMLMSMGGVPFNADSLWQIIPEIDTRLMRLLLVTDGDQEDMRKIKSGGGLSQSQLEESRKADTTLRKAFLDFEGDFNASVDDENGRVYVGRFQAANLEQLMQDPNASLLLGMMSTQRQAEFLRDINREPWELIGNLHDWTDADGQRVFRGGNEEQLYQRLEDPYLPKNAAFDTVREIRLVEGWHDDRLWARIGQHLTIYGNGKVNVNTAKRRVLEGLLQRYVQPAPTRDSMDLIIERIQEFRRTPVALGGGVFSNPGQFVQVVSMFTPGTVDPALEQAISTKSSIFRVTSRGEVGKASVAVEAIFDFSGAPFGKVVYWNVR